MSNFGNNTIHGKSPIDVAGQPREVDHARGTAASNADNVSRLEALHDKDGDVVTLTFAPKQIQAIERAVHDAPVVDRARVEQLKTLVESGRYNVSARSTAEKLLQAEQLLD